MSANERTISHDDYVEELLEALLISQRRATWYLGFMAWIIGISFTLSLAASVVFGILTAVAP